MEAYVPIWNCPSADYCILTNPEQTLLDSAKAIFNSEKFKSPENKIAGLQYGMEVAELFLTGRFGITKANVQFVNNKKPDNPDPANFDLSPREVRKATTAKTTWEFLNTHVDTSYTAKGLEDEFQPGKLLLGSDPVFNVWFAADPATKPMLLLDTTRLEPCLKPHQTKDGAAHKAYWKHDAKFMEAIQNPLFSTAKLNPYQPLVFKALALFHSTAPCADMRDESVDESVDKSAEKSLAKFNGDVSGLKCYDASVRKSMDMRFQVSQKTQVADNAEKKQAWEAFLKTDQWTGIFKEPEEVGKLPLSLCSALKQQQQQHLLHKLKTHRQRHNRKHRK